MSREEDADVCRWVFGRKVEYIAEQPREFALDETSPLGFRTNFGGAVFTADRDWLVDDWLDVEANREVPAYTSDPAADYQVLVKVRETWEPMKLCDLRDEFNRIQERRAWDTQKAGNHDTVFGVTQYLPGDWSRAALAVLKARE